MSPTTIGMAAASMFAVPALVWSVVAHNFWEVARSRPTLRHPAMLALPAVALVAFNAWLSVLLPLLPAALRAEPHGARTLLVALQDLTTVVLIAVFRHAASYSSFRAVAPSRRWLVINYGACAAAILVVVAGYSGLLDGSWAPGVAVGLVTAYDGGMFTLMGWELWRYARRGGWRAGGIGEPHRLDILFMGFGLLALLASAFVALANGRMPAPFLLSGASPLVLVGAALESAGMLAFAVPFVVRIVVDVGTRLIVAGGLTLATASIYFGARHLTLAAGDAESRRLVDLAAIAAVVLIVGPAGRWLHAGAERLLLRRARLRRSALQAFLQTLSPELGVSECCRRALAELARVLQLDGAAILLREGETIVHGDIATPALDRHWPRGAAMDALPTWPFVADELGRARADLIEALIDADVPGVVPIVSPRGRWGDLFPRTGLMGATRIGLEDAEAVDAFADQLALVLDGAMLLARAVAVERSLAHAEKLAAIGETAARIAHDIRNPVTAARSLAQQLAAAPDSPFAAEHTLILEELDRVERQVGLLLRFARREELRAEPVDLVDLVRGTVGALRPRFEAARILLEVTEAGGVVAHVDREKIRHALINLIENAVDALAERPDGRRLRVEVAATNGTATLNVVDNGPGVDAAALARLFEPFFSLKSTGTGLGLAIARRTLEAHGGRIAAASAPGAGMTMRVELPLAPPPAGGVTALP